MPGSEGLAQRFYYKNLTELYKYVQINIIKLMDKIIYQYNLCLLMYDKVKVYTEINKLISGPNKYVHIYNDRLTKHL